MTPAELIAASRRWLNDEVVATYKWTDTELVDYFNNCIDQIARETDYFQDATTTLLTEIALTAGTGDYAFDTRLLEIVSARVAGETQDLHQTTHRECVAILPTWRYSNSASGVDIVLAAAAITSTTTDFLDAGFAADDFIQITGSATAGNNKTIKLDTVAQYSLALDSSYTLTPRIAGDRLILKQLTVGTPWRYMTDYRQGYLTLAPAPDSAGSLLMTVIRLADTPLTTTIVATPGSWVIPVNLQYHLQLVDGICAKAYMKSGPSTFNIEKSRIHQVDFNMLKDRIKRDMIKLNKPPTNLSPHYGAT
jgi:hypothetical protein